MKLNKLFIILLLLFSPLTIWAQSDTLQSKFKFQGDFRFRAEQDWDSRKSDGSFRDDRTRLRYRVRAGVEYQHKANTLIGIRLRTGNPRKQQDPQLTLGDAFNEFGTLPIAFEKAFLSHQFGEYTIWLGKNTFPFKKQNELFWSDNVFPDGMHLSKHWQFNSPWLDAIDFNTGHFILNARGNAFKNDSYFEGFQLVSSHFDKKLSLWPSLYVFRNIQNIPDGAETTLLDYTIISLGGSITIRQSPLMKIEFDLYQNLEVYSANSEISRSLQDQKQGLTLALSIGSLNSIGDWFSKLTYNYQERFSAVDFLAQNDWARWDYSEFDSPDGRLTNYKGFEFVLAHAIDTNINLVMKYYTVNQLVPLGNFLETNQRIRFDIDIKF